MARTQLASLVDRLPRAERTKLLQLLKAREANRRKIEALMRRPRTKGAT